MATPGIQTPPMASRFEPASPQASSVEKWVEESLPKADQWSDLRSSSESSSCVAQEPDISSADLVKSKLTADSPLGRTDGSHPERQPESSTLLSNTLSGTPPQRPRHPNASPAGSHLSPSNEALPRSYSDFGSMSPVSQGTTPNHPEGSKPPLPRRRSSSFARPCANTVEIAPRPDVPKGSPSGLSPDPSFSPASESGTPWKGGRYPVTAPHARLPPQQRTSDRVQRTMARSATAMLTRARKDDGSITPELVSLQCPRSRSISGTAGRAWAHIGDSASQEHLLTPGARRRQAEGGFRWPSSQGGLSSSPLSYRSAGSMRLSPKQPPPPLELELLVKALAGDDVEAIRSAAGSVRMALKGWRENKAQLIQAGGIPHLVQLAQSADEATQEHGVSALFNVCREESAGSEIAAAGGLEVLVCALKATSAPTRETAAASLFCLTGTVENRMKVRSLGAMPLLVEMLKTGQVREQKDGALALFNLMLDHEAVPELVAIGGVKVLLSLLQGNDEGVEEKAMAVLALVSKISEGAEAIAKENGLAALIDVLELASQRAREDAVSALVNLCNKDEENLGVLWKEGCIPALRKIAQSNSERAKNKAGGLLQLLRSYNPPSGQSTGSWTQ